MAKRSEEEIEREARKIARRNWFIVVLGLIILAILFAFIQIAIETLVR